jgi:hypothetical protein
LKRALDLRRQWIEFIVRDELGKVVLALNAVTEADLLRTIINAALVHTSNVDATDSSTLSFPELCEWLHGKSGSEVTQQRWTGIIQRHPDLVRHTGPLVEECFEEYLFATCDHVADSTVQRFQMELKRAGSKSSFEELNATLLRLLSSFRDVLRTKGVKYEPKLFVDLGLEEPASAEPQAKPMKPNAAMGTRQHTRQRMGDVNAPPPIVDLETHDWNEFFQSPTVDETDPRLMACKLTNLRKFFKTQLQGDVRLLVNKKGVAGDQRSKITFTGAIIKSRDRLCQAKRQRKE